MGETTLAARFPAETRRLRWLIGVTLLLLAVGLVAPIVTLNQFVLLENTFSLLGGALESLRNGEWLLFGVILGFSVLLPLLKLGVLWRMLGRDAHEGARLDRHLRRMHRYGKWSMLDVFVVAVLVAAVKLGAIASVEIRYGLYAFGAAVVLTMLITARVVRLADRLGASAHC